MTTAKQRGTVTRIVRDKGFGFLSGADDGRDYFFHRSACSDFVALVNGSRVTFTAAPDNPKGPRADHVDLVEQ